MPSRPMTSREARHMKSMFNLPVSQTTARRSGTKGGNKQVPVVAIVKQKRRSKIPNSIFAPSEFIKMKYVEKVDLQTGTDVNVYGVDAQFQLNSIRQPKSGQSTGDPLPQGFDSMTGNYANYKVYGAKVRAIFSHQDQEAGFVEDGVTCGVLPTQSSESDTIFAMTQEELGMKRDQWQRDLSTSGTQKQVYSRYFDIWKLEGLTSDQFKNDISTYKGTFTSGPAAIPQIEFAIMNNSDSSDVSVELRVEITYYVRFYNRNMLAISRTPA